MGFSIFRRGHTTPQFCFYQGQDTSGSQEEQTGS